MKRYVEPLTYQEGSNDSVVSGFTLLPFTFPNIPIFLAVVTTKFLISLMSLNYTILRVN